MLSSPAPNHVFSPPPAQIPHQFMNQLLNHQFTAQYVTQENSSEARLTFKPELVARQGKTSTLPSDSNPSHRLMLIKYLSTALPQSLNPLFLVFERKVTFIFISTCITYHVIKVKDKNFNKPYLSPIPTGQGTVNTDGYETQQEISFWDSQTPQS